MVAEEHPPELTGTCFTIAVERDFDLLRLYQTEFVSSGEMADLIDAVDVELGKSDVSHLRVRVNSLIQSEVRDGIDNFNRSNNPNAICQIKNLGEITAQELTLSIDKPPLRIERDGAPVFEVPLEDSPDLTPSRFQFDLGRLAPSTIADISIWTIDPALLGDPSIIISHKDGRVELDQLRLSPSFNKEGSDSPLWIALLSLAIALILSIADGLRRIQKRPPPPEATA